MQTSSLLLGCVVTLYLVSAAFFARFWTRTSDRLFLCFAIAFALEGLNTVLIASLERPNEGSPLTFAVRTSAFLLILIAIIDRNWRARNRR